MGSGPVRKGLGNEGGKQVDAVAEFGVVVKIAAHSNPHQVLDFNNSPALDENALYVPRQRHQRHSTSL